MSAFGDQTLRGFDWPKPPRNHGLLGLAPHDKRHSSPAIAKDRSTSSESSFGALVDHRQARPSFEAGVQIRRRALGLGTAAEVFVHAAIVSVINLEQARRNAPAIALLNAWLDDDPGGEASEEWSEIRSGLDASRPSNRKLFP